MIRQLNDSEAFSAICPYVPLCICKSYTEGQEWPDIATCCSARTGKETCRFRLNATFIRLYDKSTTSRRRRSRKAHDVTGIAQ